MQDKCNLGCNKGYFFDEEKNSARMCTCHPKYGEKIVEKKVGKVRKSGFEKSFKDN